MMIASGMGHTPSEFSSSNAISSDTTPWLCTRAAVSAVLPVTRRTREQQDVLAQPHHAGVDLHEVAVPSDRKPPEEES